MLPGLKLRFSPPFFKPLRLTSSSRSRSRSPSLCLSASAMAGGASLSTVEHIVLFKVRDSTDPSKFDSMLTSLRGLSSLPFVAHISAGPVLRHRSAAADEFAFTHLLHSRYASKADLSAYANDPKHLEIVRELVLPICDDIMAVDWVADGVSASSIAPSAAARLTLAKLKEGSDASELTSVLASAKHTVSGATLVSFGENFSPGRAKGYSFGMIAAFPQIEDLDKFEGGEVDKVKEKVKGLLDSVIVLDFLVSEPAPTTASL